MVSDHLHIDAARGAAAEPLLAALLDLSVPPEPLQRALKAVPATGDLHLSPGRGPGFPPRIKAATGTALTRTEALSQLAAADLSPAIRARVEAAVCSRTVANPAVEELTPEELALALATCAAIEALGPATISASPLPLPGDAGDVNLRLLLPLLRGAVVRVDELPSGSVTPLGIALVRSLAEPAAAPPLLELAAVGTGLDVDGRPRLRVLAGRLVGDTPGEEALVLLEANLDDLPAELLATLVPRCLSSGALDAWLTPVLMKKGRPAHVLSALCTRQGWSTVQEAMFRESSTLGVRRAQVARTALDRRLVPVDTPWGTVAVKVGHSRGTPLNWAPEFDDCRRLAEQAGVPVKLVYAAALAAAAKSAACSELNPGERSPKGN